MQLITLGSEQLSCIPKTIQTHAKICPRYKTFEINFENEIKSFYLFLVYLFNTYLKNISRGSHNLKKCIILKHFNQQNLNDSPKKSSGIVAKTSKRKNPHKYFQAIYSSVLFIVVFLIKFINISIKYKISIIISIIFKVF